MQRFNKTITFLRMKQTSIKIQRDFHQEIAQKATLSSLHFATLTGSCALPAGLLPTRPSPAWHDDQYDNHGNPSLVICRAVPVPVQSPVRGRLGCCIVTLGQPTVQYPAADAARSAARAAQASSWVSSSQSLDCCSPAAHLSSQTGPGL